MSGDFGGQVIYMPLPVICSGILVLGKFALPEQEGGGSPHYGTFVHCGLSDKFPEISVMRRNEKCRAVCGLNLSA